MLNNWLQPVQLKNILSIKELSIHQWGRVAKIYKKSIPNLKDVKLAIVGIEEGNANAVRRHLYTMTAPINSLPVADLGNFRKIHPEFIIPVLAELQENGIIPIIIGGHHAFTYAQYKAFSFQNYLINAVVANERIAYTSDRRKKDKDYFYLNKILQDKKHFLFNLSHIGHQTHFVDTKTLDAFDKKGFECTRLGKMKDNLAEIEPFIRDADMLSFDISVLKQSEAPGHQLPSPSGIFAEEACQIAYYAGMSDKMTSFGLYGYYPEHDRQDQTAQLIAQMIWYFSDGFCHRLNDLPINANKFTRYAVNVKGTKYELIFWKSKKSERWWVQMPTISNRKQKRHQVIPCSLNDYNLACQGEIPNRLLNASKRFV